MPTYYEGAPIASFENTVSEKDYVRAWEIFEMRRGTLRGREIKCFFSLSAAVLCAVQSVAYRSNFFTAAVLCVLIAVFLLLFFYFLFLKPRSVRNYAGEVFRSQKTLALSEKIEIYRDSFRLQNEYETLCGYWTDFSECVETPGLLVLLKGTDRILLVIDKEQRSEEEKRLLSEHFSSVYARGYRLLKK